MAEDSRLKSNRNAREGLRLSMGALQRTTERVLDDDDEFDANQISLALTVAAEVIHDLTKMNRLALKAIVNGGPA